ncbi:MAG: helix-turn-helix transcriptional regulator [Phycisphaeraceae bacterium]
MSERWMRVSEAAAALSVSESTVRRRVSEGRLPGRIGASGRQEVRIVDAAATSSCAGEPRVAGEARAVAGESTSCDPDDLVKRYERLAGGSLVLAQQRADELNRAASAAYENLAHARSQLRQLRKLALAGWAGCVLAVLSGCAWAFALGVAGAEAQARADAHEQASQQANLCIDRLQHQLANARDVKSPDGVSGVLAGAD